MLARLHGRAGSSRWVAAFVVALAVAMVAPIAPATVRGQGPDTYTKDRNQMVNEFVVGAGVKNTRVISAMRATPRHEFVPSDRLAYAHYDMAIAIGEKQTISPPFIVAYMTEQLDPQPDDVVLEIGTGSGYQAAVLSPLVKDVYSIEIVERLGRKAAATLKRLGYQNVHTKVGDGYQGWPEHAPFDKIIVTCSPEDIPEKLVEQLREGGRMVIPLGERFNQTLYLYRKVDGKMVPEALEPTMFVPMTGQAEELRDVQPDPKHPKLVNGSFEEIASDGDWPVGWYYFRQSDVVEDAEAQKGQKYVRFTNREPGRLSQTLQAFAVDSKAAPMLEVSLMVRAKGVVSGGGSFQSGLLLTFFDSNRAYIGQAGIGPWSGTFDWTRRRAQIQVPARAETVILAVGLLGATGEVSIDDVYVGADAGNSTALPSSNR